MEEINVRLASDSDIDRINEFYNSVYKQTRTRKKFEWEFNTSPAGKAIYVLAEHGNKVVGTQCVIPYFLITHDNRTILSGKSEDTLVSLDYRGKNIFEKMYALLFEACRQKSIAFIWGFTYASKPFLKLGFQVPFRSKMGLLVLKPGKTARYLDSLAPNNSGLNKLKIAGLSFSSWLKALPLRLSPLKLPGVQMGHLSLNEEGFNYLEDRDSYGLKLDKEFIDYRINTNPYSNRYKTLYYKKGEVLLISMTLNITSQRIGYVIHLYISDKTDQKDWLRFLANVLSQAELKDCSVLRFWGFDHNLQNKKEINRLRRAGFIFINRGISFVWLPLNANVTLDPKKFVLSRMSSQGTD